MHQTDEMSPLPITTVSGLPRSGTSLMMQMLAAGGVPPLTDGLRTADESNPRGYYEFERVKQLRSDQAWLEQARGHAVKIIHLLLRELPVDGRFQYRVLLMRRPIAEILSSQRVMLERQSKQSADPGVLAKVYAAQLADVEQWMTQHGCFSVCAIDHQRAIHSPAEVAGEVARFLGGNLDTAAMAACVDPALYRQRA
ncbi:hypothetical protein BH20VER1_BH20VER1_15120 [soil metagenome]